MPLSYFGMFETKTPVPVLTPCWGVWGVEELLIQALGRCSSPMAEKRVQGLSMKGSFVVLLVKALVTSFEEVAAGLLKPY